MRGTIGAGLALLLLAGCNQGMTVTQNGSSVTVEKDGETVSVNSKDCARAAHGPLYADA